MSLRCPPEREHLADHRPQAPGRGSGESLLHQCPVVLGRADQAAALDERGAPCVMTSELTNVPRAAGRCPVRSL